MQKPDIFAPFRLTAVAILLLDKGCDNAFKGVEAEATSLTKLYTGCLKTRYNPKKINF